MKPLPPATSIFRGSASGLLVNLHQDYFSSLPCIMYTIVNKFF
jgi:hypothetical protein